MLKDNEDSKFLKVNSINSSMNEISSRDVKRIKTKLMEDGELHYKDEPINDIDLSLIKRMRNVPKCIVLENGLRQTKEKVKFFYCSCDPNEIFQICEECALTCHKAAGHRIKEQPPAYIKCSCGEKVHIININHSKTIFFKQNCFYHEMAKYAGLNMYFINNGNEKVCLFCTNFCNENKTDPNKKVTVNSSQEIPECECSHRNHSYIKTIYTLTNSIGFKSAKLNLYGLKQVQMVNLLIKCKDSYANLYSDLEMNDKPITDKKIHLTNYFFALKNFALISKTADGLKYFSQTLLRIPSLKDEFIKSIVNQEFEDSISLWTVLTYIFQAYKHITLGYYTRAVPKFKIFDLENMSSLQRSALLNKNKEEMKEFLKRYFNSNENFIDLFISVLNKVNSTRFESLEAYDVIYSITSILRYFSSFYLFTNSQMINFCEELDRMFPIFTKIRIQLKHSQNYKRVNEKESKLFLKVLKTLHLFVYCYNDQLVLNSLNEHLASRKNYENMKFIHDKTEIGRCIFRITMKILHIVSSEYSEENKDHYTVFNKILRHGTQILNLFANSTDPYVISLKKNIYNTEAYLEILTGNFNSEYLQFFIKETKEIEQKLEDYANFNLNKKSICHHLGEVLDQFFEMSQFQNYDPGFFFNNDINMGNKSCNFSLLNDDEDKFTKKNLLKRLRMNESSYTAEFLNEKKKNSPDIVRLEKMRNLLYQSNFLFSVVKIFKLVNLNPVEDKQLVKKIYSLLWFFVDKNSDNAMVVLSWNILNPLKHLHHSFANKNFELYLHCIQLLSAKEELGFSKHLIKKLSNYLLKLPNNYEDKYICLNYFLKILDSVLNDVKSLNYSLTIMKMKTIMKVIFEKYSIFYDFLKFLITVTEDVMYGKYNYFNIEDYDEKKEGLQKNNQKIIFELSENEQQDNTRFTIYNSLTFNIFYLFLKITNKIFDSSNIEDRIYLCKILKKEELVYILKNTALNLNIRTEIIKFYRKTSMDIFASENKESFDPYIRALVKQMDKSQILHRAVNNFPADLYSFYEDLIKISESINTKLKMNSSLTYSIANPNMTTKFDKDMHEFIIQEVKNYKEIVESTAASHKNVKSTILNYFENGLVIPLSLYFRKIFSTVNNLSGEDFLNIYELLPHVLNMKKYFIKMDIDISFLPNIKEHEISDIKKDDDQLHRQILEEIFNNLKGYNNMTTYLVSNVIASTKNSDITRDLDKIKSKSFPVFDYTSCHQIIDSQHFSMLQKPGSINLDGMFKRVNEEAQKEQLENTRSSLKELSVSEVIIKLYEIAITYQNRKGNLEAEFSSLGQGLDEVCIEYETTYRNLLLRYLIFVLTKNNYLNTHFSLNANFILFKLLQYHTGEIQGDLEKILEVESKMRTDEKKKQKANNKDAIPLPVKDPQNYEEVIKMVGDDESERRKSLFIFFEKSENNKLGFLNSFADQLFQKLISIFVSDFNPRDLIYNTDYLEAYNIIKIFKFMCEEHNNFFQGNLIKKLCFSYNIQFDSKLNRTYSDKINFFDLLLLIVNNILLWSNWGEAGSKEDNYNIDFFFDLFSAIIELLIELIQGNLQENLSYITINNAKEDNQKKKDHTLKEAKLNKSALQVFVENINKSLLFHDGDSNSVLYAVRTQLMNFMLTILEEKNCSEELKNYIIDSLSVNKVVSSINNTLKIYFLEKTKEDKHWSSYKKKHLTKKLTDRKASLRDLHHAVTIMNNSKEYKNYKFNEILFKYFYDEYFVFENGFPKSPEFEFANTLYRYIKLISIAPYQNEEANSLINKVSEINEQEIIKAMNNPATKEQIGVVSTKNSENPYNLISQKIKSHEIGFCEQYFIIKFFEQITQMVEVVSKDKQNTTVIFTVMPTIHYLSNDSKSEFLKSVNRENQFTKLFDLIRNVDYFKEEIEYNSTRSSNKIYTFLKNLDFSIIQMLLFLFAFAINLIIFITLDGDRRKIYNFTDGTFPPPVSTNKSDLTDFLNDTIDANILYERNSIHNMIIDSVFTWGKYYYSLTFSLIALCGFFIICYLYAKVPLYYQIELIKQTEHHNISKDEISFWRKVGMIIGDVIYGRDHINTLLFMTISGILAVAFEMGDMEMFFSLMLLSIVNINPTLKNITVSVKLKYKELLSTLMFTFIIIYSYSSIGFYFFQSRFSVTLDNKQDNYCESLIFCFLSHSNGGFRIEGGIGDFLLQKVSFERTPGLYAGRYFYDFISFIIVNIVMRELVFGIIIETFKELRIEEHYYEHDKMYICFICGVTKDELEKDRIDFTHHCENDHNIWNYINYMIRLKFSDPQDLNAINSYTLEQIEKKYTNWIPLYNKKKEREKSEEMDDVELNVNTDKYNEIHPDLQINKN